MTTGTTGTTRSFKWWMIPLGLLVIAALVFAIIGFRSKVGHIAWSNIVAPGEWFKGEQGEPEVQTEGEPEVQTEGEPEVQTEANPADDNPILPDMPGSDIHTQWVGDIAFQGWKGQVNFPNDLVQEMVDSEHVYSLHKINAEDNEMIFLITWGNDIKNVAGAWIVNEYNVENFNWDYDSPEDFFDRFVEEIQDWTAPNSISEDDTIEKSTTVDITIFIGTNDFDAEEPYAEFEYTK